jgi:Lrp/AsnC family leucine-responsive transcriptional regulator
MQNETKTEKIRRRLAAPAELDQFDRKILSELSVNARKPYVEIGKSVGLSAPAVYERVKRMRAANVFLGTTIQINPAAVGKPLLAFIHVEADGWGKNERLMSLSRFPEIEDMHSVAGDTSLIIKARTSDTLGLEHLLSQIYAVPGVRSTKTYVVLSSLVERPAHPEMTREWPKHMVSSPVAEKTLRS